MLIGLLTSLMCSCFEMCPVNSAERLEVQFEDMSIPIPINDLVDWVDGMSIPNSIKELSEWALDRESDNDLSSWLNLLDLESRAELVKILKAPLIKNRSMARQILRSWVGRQLLDEFSDLVRLDDDKSGNKVFNTLEKLLESQPQVTTLDLLLALPGQKINLDLDAFLKVANRWRSELNRQKQLVVDLGNLPSSSQAAPRTQMALDPIQEPVFSSNTLMVEHRSEPLRLEIWQPSEGTSIRSSWIVFMPGWGGAPDHFRWLARRLSSYGWPIVVLEHPGSNAKAVQELLEGRRLAPGAEVLPNRLKDLYSVLRAKDQGELKISGDNLVLMGHSLGALTAFLAAGAIPEEGLDSRCEKALDALSLTNLSQLLQCQMVDVELPNKESISGLKTIIAINSFGGLLWPNIGGTNISMPIFLAGGTYDLITPALSEQLRLLLATMPNLLSRILLIEGASHFSPIRVQGQLEKAGGEDLFQLGEAFVGVQPLAVQSLLGDEILRYLEAFELNKPIDLIERQKKNDLQFYLLDRLTVEKLLTN